MELSAGRDLVHRWRSGTPAATPVAPGPAPVSKAQRGVLVFERLRPGTAVFHLRFAARHTGELDEARLDRALAALVRRHPALRSAFPGGDAGPARVVLDDVAVAVRWTDLRHLSADRRWDAARDLAAAAAAEPFDLAQGPLVRVHGYRLTGDERLLLFVAHHLVCDGGSMRVLLGELDRAYRGELRGLAPSPVPPPADPAALGHWREHLAGLPELDLPVDRPRPPRPTFAAGSVPLAVPAGLAAAAERLARDEGTTLFTVVLAAFQVLLGRHSGQTGFAVGCPEAGRTRPGRHGAVGLLSDLLVLRTDLSGRPSFREVVRRARATCLDALTHRGVPFEDLVAALAPGRNVDSPLVRAGIAFQGDWGAPTLAGSPLRQVAVARPGLRYDLELQLWREDGALWGTWDYSAEAYDAVTATRMANRLPALLASGLADPDTPLDRLDLLTGDERALLDRWGNGPEVDGPDVSLLDLFGEQVRRVPDAVAVEDPQRRLTYRRLDECANQLAHLLRARGTGAGDIVGIRLGRTVDLAVAMLGIMKAGAAYLPLDPAYPADRTDYMLRDAGARTVVTRTVLDAAADRPVTDPGAVPVPPDRPAYVLYTSGSTGRPKGVLLTHRNAVPVVRWSARAFTREQMSRVLASTSICFDVSVFEFFATLCTGGTVVVVDNALALLAEPPAVTMISSVPSAARALVEADALPAGARVVCLGGEAVTGTLPDDLYATGDLDQVVNCYGPTEDTTYSTTAVLREGEQPPPIGALLPGGRGHVLDGDLRRVPVGAVGELYLAGQGLSLGYLNRSALTASRYVADPYARTPGALMYRTGDLVRYRSDGALLYLGRRDFQVKVRGQRIELGEIETVLLRHPQVGEAAVRLHDGRLVGYLAGAGGGAVDQDDVRAHLRRTLPIVMIPAVLVVLPALPHTPNGKVDRLALPAPDAPVAAGGEPPRGDDEELVARVWQDVLGLETVGRDDDFFDLGGDSLTAGDVLHRLRERAGRSLPLRTVFENSRLADLAATLAAPQGSPTAGVIAPRPAGAAPVLSFEQQRTWLECQLKPGAAYNVHGRQRLRGVLDVPALERSLRTVIGRHEALRTVFPVVRGLPMQEVTAPDPRWRLTLADGTVDQARRLADADAARPFDLRTGPLFRCLLVRVSDTEHLLSLTAHHIVSDGLSVGLIVRELSALYRAGGDPRAAGLPALPVQYRDYAVWQRATLTGETLAASLGYWRDRLAGAPAELALPTARRRLPVPGAGGKVRADLGADQVAALHKLCRVHGVTPFMAVLTALATVLRRWSGQDDLVVGVPVHTRRAAGTEALVGLFVNTVPLRVDLSGDPAFGDVLERVRRTAVDGVATHGSTPFDVLVGELRPAHDPLRTPLFQVLLSVIEDAGDQWQLPGVDVDQPELPPQPGKVDLGLDVHHRDGHYRLELHHHAGRYAPAAMRALLGQVTGLLAAAADDPARGILEYDLGAPSGPDEPERPPPPGVGAGDRVAVLGGDAGLRAYVSSAGAAVVAPEDLATATAVCLSGPALRGLEPGGTLPLLRHVFLDNRGDLTAHDVTLARSLAPGPRVVALWRPAPGREPLAAYEIPGDWSAATAPLRVPIGAGLALRNAAGRPTATGEAGEIRAGGEGTGCLARRGPDGIVEYAAPPGDPLEVVAALRDVPGVRDAVVTGATAYVLRRGDGPDPAALHRHLTAHLPRHRIPEHIVPVDRLPPARTEEHPA
ncbi:amino acid adenylation domain-containing protein [Actinoplanes sp. NPDC049316]|uniref:amino acid adenylation domain-containing protein n=1 Tax=Actinoplanes sp. NPDC049316 TaxID=3154727 RepID=UPI003439CD67